MKRTRLPKTVRLCLATAVPGVETFKRVPAVYRRGAPGLCAAKRVYGDFPRRLWSVVHVPSGCYVTPLNVTRAQAVALLPVLAKACDWTRDRATVMADKRAAMAAKCARREHE